MSAAARTGLGSNAWHVLVQLVFADGDAEPSRHVVSNDGQHRGAGNQLRRPQSRSAPSRQIESPATNAANGGAVAVLEEVPGGAVSRAHRRQRPELRQPTHSRHAPARRCPAAPFHHQPLTPSTIRQARRADRRAGADVGGQYGAEQRRRQASARPRRSRRCRGRGGQSIRRRRSGRRRKPAAGRVASRRAA